MSATEPFIGLIKMWPSDRIPVGWLRCDGTLYNISEYDTLFAIIGTTYGGDGESTFAVPNLQSRMPIGIGQGSGLNNIILGETFGVETITLTQSQMPQHNHGFIATTNEGNAISPQNNIKANSGTNDNEFRTTGTLTTMVAGSISATGGGQPIDIRQPYLGTNFIIAAFGVFPTQQ